MEQEELSAIDNKILNARTCPICFSRSFYHIAWGGLAENICCENGHRFWFAPPFIAQYQGQENVKVTEEGLTILPKTGR